jgi:O-antigen ligase
MTSKGLKKDSVGITQLTPVDISRIEHGITNIIYSNKLGLKPRLYEVIWEFDQYKHGSGVNTHSVTQRIIYMQIALSLIKENFWFGVGTGDLPMKYANYYKTHDTGLSKERQFHTHNQFLRFFVLFGIFGFLIIIAAFIIPVFLERKWSSYYMIMIITIILLSFLNEDTLETQIGVTFATLFYSIFLWGCKKNSATE